MGVLRNIRANWKAADAAQKICIIINLISGIGGAVLGGDLYLHVAPAANKVEKVALGVTCAGLGVAAGNIAGDALCNAYAPVINFCGRKIENLKEEDKEEEKPDAGNE